MKRYFLNTLIGIFLGYLIGFLYISSIDKTLFDNHISNQNHFDQSFSCLLFPFILIWILFFHSEIKKRNLKKIFDIQVLVFLVGCFFGGFIIYCIGNLIFSFTLILLISEEFFIENIGGFTSGTIAGMIITINIYQKTLKNEDKNK